MPSTHQINEVIFNRAYMLREKNNEIWLSMVHLNDSCLQGSREQELVG